MIKTYLKIAWRNLQRNTGFSIINIIGLAVGMAVVILIGLWIWDELSYNKYHQHYDRIAQVMRQSILNGEITTRNSTPVPMRQELESRCGDDLTYITISSQSGDHILSAGDKQLIRKGRFMEAAAPALLSLNMRQGSDRAFNDPSSILLSQSTATALFGNVDPVNKLLRIDNNSTVKVAGVYSDLPDNSTFKELGFLAPWALHVATDEWTQKAQRSWSINSYEIYVQLAPHTTIDKVTAKIKSITGDHMDKKLTETRKPTVFLYPMSRWHLYSEWKNGINTGTRMQFVWLFAIIGIFVLLLACINFINLSTAGAEKRAKEVGVRKTIGSMRSQLIAQFFCESAVLVILSLLLSLLLIQLALPFFNGVADKKMTIPWTSPVCWLITAGFVVLTSVLAGCYPAFYLSSFRPIKVLRGTFRAASFAAWPRKILVTVQFTVSVTLIIATCIVYRQVQYAKDRPVGYSRDGLISIRIATPELRKHYTTLQDDLLKTGSVVNMAASGSPATDVWDNRSGFEWPGKDPDLQADFATISVTYEYGQTVGWQFLEGRDFSKAYSTDLASGIVLNEAAATFMGLKKPIGKTITWGNEKLNVLGVIKDMLMTSPYEPVKQTIFYLNYERTNFIILRINPRMSAHTALGAIETVFKRYDPATPFTFKFVDEEYAIKFAGEERIGTLAGCFALLAIFISCMGLFGLTTFVAAQRTKEIGIRKVFGATVFILWAMLSKEFVVLVVVSCLIATPLAWHFLDQWIQQYQYHTTISWWIFALVGIGALLITLITVSYQSIKAAMINPVRSLRSE
jgi:ABC-type antimicrobial peptide transport system permease subunit